MQAKTRWLQGSGLVALAALAAFVFVLACLPGAALADEGDSAGVGAAGTQLVAGSSDLMTQDSVDQKYIAKTVAIQPNKSYSRNFSKYMVHMFTFKSAGGTYKLTVNNNVKVNYQDVYAFVGNAQNSPDYLLAEQSSKGKKTYNLGKIKKGKTVTIELNAGQLSSSGKVTFKVTGKGGATASSGTSKSTSSTGKSTTSKSSTTKTTLKSSNTKVSVKDAKYTGKAVKPTVTVKCNGKKLKKGTDYTLKYSNNVKVGTAKVKMTGKGKYKGSITKKFKVKPKGKVYTLVYGGEAQQERGHWTDYVALKGSSNNVKEMNLALFGLDVPGYEYKVANKKSFNKTTFSKAQFTKALKSAFRKATKNDICIVYLNTHGSGFYIDETETAAEGTGLYLSSGVAEGEANWWSYKDVLDTLASNIKGKIVLLPEVCYSGGFVNAAPGCKAKNRLTVISSVDQYSSSGTDNSFFTWASTGGGVGWYTEALIKALTTKKADGYYDGNKDGKITVREIHEYIWSYYLDHDVDRTPYIYASNKNLVLR